MNRNWIVKGLIFYLIAVTISISNCSNSKEVIDNETYNELKTVKKKGLIKIYEDRGAGYGNSSYVTFYPLKDSSYTLTLDNFKSAEYDTGFTISGMSGGLRHDLIDRHKKLGILKNRDLYFPLELKYNISKHIFSKNVITDSASSVEMRQRFLHSWRTSVSYLDFSLLIE